MDEILLLPLVTSVMTRGSSVFATLPDHSSVIVRAPNLGSPSPSFLGTPSLSSSYHSFSGILALATPQVNNPCQLYVGSPHATERRKYEIYTTNERQTTRTRTQDPTHIQYCASSHHNRNLPLSLGGVKIVMKGYCPPTSMGLPITLLPPIFSI